MAFFVDFRLSLPGIKQGTIFGEGKLPIKLYHLGIVTIIRMDVRHTGMLNELVKAGLSPREFLVENAESVRLARKREVARVRKQAYERAQIDKDYWRDRCEALTKLHEEERGRRYKVEQALDVLVEFRDERLKRLGMPGHWPGNGQN